MATRRDFIWNAAALAASAAFNGCVTAPEDIPDFTRGGWKSAQPLGIVSMDVSKFDFESRRTCGKTAQMDV